MALGLAVLVAAFIKYGFQWPWRRASLAALLVGALALLLYRFSQRTLRSAWEAESASLRVRRIYELTRRTLELDLHQEPGPRLAALVHEIFEVDAVAVFDADLQEVYKAGSWTVDPSELVQNVYHFGTSDDDRATGLSRRVILLGSVPIGALVLRGDTTPLVNSAIAALIAATFDRYRAFANENRIESERQAEQLRATVLDNLAHDYKTPLTAIRAASSGLSEMGRLSPAQAELVALIDEQAALLSDLTTRLLTTARMEADDREEDSGGVSLQISREPVYSLIETAVQNLGDRSADARVVIDLPDQEMFLDCDARLIVMLLSQYLDNACKYAEFDSTITIRAVRSEEEFLFSVHSFGPVIPMADRERIFDRYFRSSSASRHISGTGIGLSIAKRAAQAHGGSVWVSSGEEEGTTFFAALPAPEDIDRADSREESTRATELNSPLNSHSGSGLHPTGADLPARTFQRSMS